MPAASMTAISLFSSAGIGDLGLKANGFDVLTANELLRDRADLYKHNHPETALFVGDIWECRQEVIQATKERLQGRELTMAYATPPCQGMSTNGVGKLMAEVAAGNRTEEDPRNRLIIPAMDIICELRPRWVLLENVPGMQLTVIRTEDGSYSRVLDYVASRLGSEYVGGGVVLTCSDYGIPQLRRRLITVFTRDVVGQRYYRAHGGTFFPERDRRPPITLREAIGSLPALDGTPDRNSAPEFHPLHTVNVLGSEKYLWVSNTPEGETAFNNQCINPTCQYQGNARHADLVEGGRMHASKSTPIYCEKCGSLLPRPSMQDPKSGQRRLISGFHSAYRRMLWDQPARALTSNFPFEASDNKIHPSQNRVLSIYEATVIQTIAHYPYVWKTSRGPANKTLIAHVIGESVPPRLIDFIAAKIARLTEATEREVDAEAATGSAQQALFRR
jgi:DNA (cytosine-5)-methyltransferase 1